jgi:hypothetical protein
MVVNMTVVIAKLMLFATRTTLVLGLVPPNQGGHIVPRQYWTSLVQQLDRGQRQ